MKVNGKHYRTIWTDNKESGVVFTINQNKLPFKFEIVKLKSSGDVINAITNMIVRGAPLIGAAGAFGIYLALLEASKKHKNISDIEKYVCEKASVISDSRPTAINLQWAVRKVMDNITKQNTTAGKIKAALKTSNKICDNDVKTCRKIGTYGKKIITDIAANKSNNTVNILTHCNAGWLAVVDYGTALAPVYMANKSGIKIHVWVEETRPRYQGAKLTAWELQQNGIDYSIITDNAGGYVMQKGLIDLVIVGSDRTTKHGDVCNKIGTYKTALAAFDNKIPFYAAVPMSSFDLSIENAVRDIPIEERSPDEIKYTDYYSNGKIERGLITFTNSKIRNFGFDITPSKYVSGIITEKGIIKPDSKSIMKLFSQK